MEQIVKLKSLFDKRQTEKDFLKNEKENLEANLISVQVNIDNHLTAREILIEVGLATQRLFKEKIESLVTSCLQGVFERYYAFILEIETKYNKTTAKPLIKKPKGLVLDPEEGGGGGIMDVAAFALRVVLWAMEKPRTRAFMAMDEPFKFVHGYEEEAGNIVKMISNKLGIQFLINTQIEELVAGADKIFMTELKDGYSIVEEVK